MQYRIPEHIIIEKNESVTIKDVIFHELSEQEFLMEYLKNPRLNYWQDHPDGTKQHYKNNKLMVTIFGNQVVNHAVFDNKN